MDSKMFRLQWANHLNHMQASFSRQVEDGHFCDVKITCDGGKTLQAHRSILSAFSDFFSAILIEHASERDYVIIIVKDWQYEDMKLLLDFMYMGEISLKQDQLLSFKKLAEDFQVKGLPEAIKMCVDFQQNTAIFNAFHSRMVTKTGDPPTGDPPPPQAIHQVAPKQTIEPLKPTSSRNEYPPSSSRKRLRTYDGPAHVKKTLKSTGALLSTNLRPTMALGKMKPRAMNKAREEASVGRSLVEFVHSYAKRRDSVPIGAQLAPAPRFQINKPATSIQPNINNTTSQLAVTTKTYHSKSTTNEIVPPLYSKFISAAEYDGLKSIPIGPLMNDISFIQQALRLIYRNNIRMLTHNTSFKDDQTARMSGEQYNAIRYLFEERVQRKRKQLFSSQQKSDGMCAVDVNSLISLAICNIKKGE